MSNEAPKYKWFSTWSTSGKIVDTLVMSWLIGALGGFAASCDSGNVVGGAITVLMLVLWPFIICGWVTIQDNIPAGRIN